MSYWLKAISLSATLSCVLLCSAPAEEDLKTTICRGDREKVKTSLQRGNPLSQAAYEGIAAAAIVCGKEDLITLLPDGNRHRANVLLVFACSGEKYIKRAREALENGADVNQANSLGETPFFGKNCYGDESLLRLAVAKKLDFKKKNNAGKTIFHTAAENGDLNAIRALISAGAPIPDDAVVNQTKERIADISRTETNYLPGNHKIERRIPGEKILKDTVQVPLLEFSQSRDPALYRLLLGKMQQTK